MWGWMAGGLWGWMAGGLWGWIIEFMGERDEKKGLKKGTAHRLGAVRRRKSKRNL